MIYKVIITLGIILLVTKANCQRIDDNYIINENEINDSLLIKCVKCIYMLKDKDSIIYIQQNELDTYVRILENREYQIKILENSNEIFKKMYDLEKNTKPSLFNTITYISIGLNIILFTVLIL